MDLVSKLEVQEEITKSIELKENGHQLYKRRQAQADGEYISKEKAIIQLSWDLSEVELPRIKESLDKLPSAAIPNNVGHWIEHPETETSAPEYLMFYECSECGDKQCFCKSDIYKKHFCNNCGAKMVEEQESERYGVKDNGKN